MKNRAIKKMRTILVMAKLWLRSCIEKKSCSFTAVESGSSPDQIVKFKLFTVLSSVQRSAKKLKWWKDSLRRWGENLTVMYIYFRTSCEIKPLWKLGNCRSKTIALRLLPISSWAIKMLCLFSLFRKKNVRFYVTWQRPLFFFVSQSAEFP